MESMFRDSYWRSLYTVILVFLFSVSHVRLYNSFKF